MPSKSAKQARFMQAVAHSRKFAKKAGVPQSVGKEFNRADKRKAKDGAMSKFAKIAQDEIRHDPHSGKFTSGGGGAAPAAPAAPAGDRVAHHREQVGHHLAQFKALKDNIATPGASTARYHHLRAASVHESAAKAHEQGHESAERLSGDAKAEAAEAKGKTTRVAKSVGPVPSHPDAQSHLAAAAAHNEWMDKHPKSGSAYDHARAAEAHVKAAHAAGTPKYKGAKLSAAYHSKEARKTIDPI